MTEERNALTDLFAACWKDDALKARFMADPKAVLAEYGMDVPVGMSVKVVENNDNTVHITMPAPPSSGMALPDDELGKVAGGCIMTNAIFCLFPTLADV
jgi:hypothetical protein